MILFDNTEDAFAYKTNGQLKKSNFIYTAISKNWLVNIGAKLIPIAIKFHFPFIKTILKQTIFEQFVGGESLEQTAAVANKLSKFSVQVILDYGVEGGDMTEENFDKATQTFINVIEYAATQNNIPFISIKITGLARFSLLEKLDAAMNTDKGPLIKKYTAAIENLTTTEKNEWKNVTQRLEQICKTALQNNIAVLVDAEETWIQDPIDALTILMMDFFNKTTTTIFNTVQLYRTDRLQFLKDMYEAAVEKKFTLGVKLVRGAYMEKERERAAAMQYPSPIHPNKKLSDNDFNNAVIFCIENLSHISVVIATHNEDSNSMAIEQLQQKNILLNHRNIHFSQLYGMSDHITFNLAKLGCSVSKYLPFGAVEEVIPYLLRRAQENQSVAGQTSRELMLIRKELKRRNNN